MKMIVNLLLSLPSDIFYNVPSGLGNVTLDLEKEGVKEIFDQIKPCLDITDNCNIKVLLSEWKGTTFLEIETVRGREPHYYKRFALILKNK